VLAAAGAGVLVRSLQTKDDVVDPPTLPTSVKETEQLLISGDVDGAQAYVDDRLKDTSISKEERYQLYVKQGVIAYEKKDYQAAIEPYTKAFALNENADMASKLGVTWQELGDKQKAIEFYKKAIDLNLKNSKDNPTYESDNNTLKQMIAALEEGGQ
jgi:tetratricopeptide (TPR) repeat protein